MLPTLLAASAVLLPLPQADPPTSKPSSKKAAVQLQLRHVPERGHVEHFDITTTTEMIIALEKGGRTSNETILKLRCRVEVLEVDKEGFLVGVRWVRSRGSIEVPLFGMVTWDSEEDESSLSIPGRIREPWMRLVGMEYRARLDRSGKILAMPDVKKHLRPTKKRIRKGPNSKTVQGLLDEQALRSQVQLLFPAYSATKVTVGDAWQGASADQIGNSQVVILKSQTKNRLTELGKQSAKLTVTSSKFQSGRSKLKTAKRSQQVEVNRADGMVLRSTMTAEIKKRVNKMFLGSTDFEMKFKAVVERVGKRR